MSLLFGIAFGAVLYIYFGYPLLVGLLARCFGRQPSRGPHTPSVSLLIPSFNEAAHIAAKLENSLRLDYPRDRLEIVVANDGSTDATAAIAGRYAGQGVRLINMPANVGKTEMLRRVVPQLKGEIVVFSDTSSELEPDAVRLLLENFADPRVGAACGLYRLKAAADARGEGEGLYWKYETWIKAQESRLHSILGAHGAFYAIRGAYFPDIRGGTINDDYLIPMRLVERGFRAVYDPRARAWERETSSVKGEFARRRRIAVGNCQQVFELRGLFSPRHGWVAFTFFSHKVLRTLAPVFLLAVLAASFGLPEPWRAILLTAQALFYGAAFLGFACQSRGRTVRALSPAMYFCFGNLAMLAGLWSFCFNRRGVRWGR